MYRVQSTDLDMYIPVSHVRSRPTLLLEGDDGVNSSGGLTLMTAPSKTEKPSLNSKNSWWVYCPGYSMARGDGESARLRLFGKVSSRVTWGP